MLTYGGLFEGYSGLTMAVQRVLPGHLTWFSEIEPAACRVLEHHHPKVPNLGDISLVDWSAVPRVSVLTGGFPCTDISLAGQRAGLNSQTRSGLWSHMATAIDVLRPDLVVIENVRGILSQHATGVLESCTWCVGDDGAAPLRALGCVLGNLADIGYDTRWCGLRAADVGAPHGRYRVFILAWPAGHSTNLIGEWGRELYAINSAGQGSAGGADRSALTHSRGIRFGPGRSAGSGEAEIWRSLSDPARRNGHATTDTNGAGWDSGSWMGGSDGATAERDDPSTPADADCIHLREQSGRLDGSSGTGAGITGDHGAQGAPPDWGITADASSYGRERGAQCDVRTVESRQQAPLRADATGHFLDWGAYGPAIRRWGGRLGRPAPAPTMLGKRGGKQLSPIFVEWMMGLPEGWVTAVPGVGRNEALKMLGNGVVPQQGEAAVRYLLDVSASDRPCRAQQDSRTPSMPKLPRR